MNVVEEAAKAWLSEKYHRDVWGLMREAQSRVLAIEESHGKAEDKDAESLLEELTFFQGKSQGFELAVEGFLRKWVRDRGDVALYDAVALWTAIDELWQPS